MLNIERRSHAYAYPIPRPSAASRVDFRSFVRATFRYKRLLLIAVGAALVAGSLFTLLAKPVFIAEGMLLVDPHRAVKPGISTGAGSQELFALDSAAVDSQVEMLKSEQLSRDVITKLGLVTNPDISNQGFVSAISDGLKHLIRGEPSPNEEIPASIVKELQSRLDIKRVRETYMVSLRFKSGSPDLAAAVVNTLMQAHLDRESHNRQSSIKLELDWMDERLAQLRENISAADQALRQASINGRALQDTTKLQREAESYRSVYQLLLDRYTSSLQQMSFPYAQVSIVAGARAPQEKSFPNASMILALSVVGGLLVGLGLIAYLEFSDDSFRSANQVEATLEFPVIGLLPRLRETNGPSGMAPLEKNSWGKTTIPPGRSVDQTSTQWFSTVERAFRKLLAFASMPSSTRSLPVYGGVDAYRYAAEKPMSRFAEGLRSMRAAIDNHIEGNSGRTIGLTSALPSEGAAVVAANFAYLLARTGKKVLLVDVEMRARTLTAAIPANHRMYLSDVVSGRSSLAEATCGLDDNLAFVGSSPRSKLSRGCYEIDIATVQKIIDQAAMKYDYVIVSLPPTAPLADLHTFAPALDALVVVVRWGTTSQQAVRDALALPPNIQSKILGIVLNDIDFSRLATERVSRLATTVTSINPLFED